MLSLIREHTIYQRNYKIMQDISKTQRMKNLLYLRLTVHLVMFLGVEVAISKFWGLQRKGSVCILVNWKVKIKTESRLKNEINMEFSNVIVYIYSDTPPIGVNHFLKNIFQIGIRRK